ncbi:MAG: DUF4339 domain-containing protein [Planctomycetes bacterium]|nr:DUF4339 domain-containing protein [Planctomycetota bacterium]
MSYPYPAQWYAYVNGQVVGPFTAEQLAAMARGGAIAPDTPLCGDGRTYLPASQALPQLFAPPGSPMGPPMMAMPAARRGGKGVLLAALGAAVVAAGVAAFFLPHLQAGRREGVGAREMTA